VIEYTVEREVRFYARRYMIVLSVREQVRDPRGRNVRYVKAKGRFV